MNTPLTIDVLSDVVCPWCLIGKRRLELALTEYAQRYPERPAPLVRWHPFQLNPDMPEAGMSRVDYVRQKFGDRADTVYDRVKAVGRSLDIPFAIDAIARQPNTAAAHSLIGLAEVGVTQQKLVEALFQAYFLEGVDLTQRNELERLALGAGLPAEDVRACLDSEEAREHVRASDERARQMGVQGVPFFIFNNQVGVSGAHEPETLLQAMEQSLQPPAEAAHA
jgi:predicted DsbA family dithiol-disulfide isomerase